MVLFLFSDPKYSILTEGLIKSLRHNGNNYKIYYYMMNFDDNQAQKFSEKFSEDKKIIYKRKTVDMRGYKVHLHGGVANPLYQNNRVSYLIELMEEQKEDILLFQLRLVDRLGNEGPSSLPTVISLPRLMIAEKNWSSKGN